MEPSIVFSSMWGSERRGWGWGNLTAVCSGKGTGVEVSAINRRGGEGGVNIISKKSRARKDTALTYKMFHRHETANYTHINTHLLQLSNTLTRLPAHAIQCRTSVSISSYYWATEESSTSCTLWYCYVLIVFFFFFFFLSFFLSFCFF